MLKRVRRSTAPTPTAGRIAIVASEYNAEHVGGLLHGAREILEARAIPFEVFRVPGAFEIPVVAETLAGRTAERFAAVICLGVIIRGATAHADLVGESVTRALMETAVRHRVPVIHEVLLVASVAQAEARCLDPRHNRGAEAARTALLMGRLLGKVRSRDQQPRVRRHGSRS